MVVSDETWLPGRSKHNPIKSGRLDFFSHPKCRTQLRASRGVKSNLFSLSNPDRAIRAAMGVWL